MKNFFVVASNEQHSYPRGISDIYVCMDTACLTEEEKYILCMSVHVGPG